MTSPFVPAFISEPFPTNAYDPVIFGGEHFGDGQHRVLVMFAGSHKALYKTADFDTFTEVVADWRPDIANDGANTFQCAVALPDGTFVLYQNDLGETNTAVWTATAADIDADTPTRLGRVLTTEGDCGAFYDSVNDLIHIYSEDADSPFGSVSSSKLSHWTTPADDLLNATQHANATDNGGAWGTGDPCVIEHAGSYWMFTDYTENHPAYWISLYRSDDLYTWELVDPKLTEQTGVRAGDFDVIPYGDGWLAMCEYTGGNAGVGVFELTQVGLVRTSLTLGGTRQAVTIGGVRQTVRFLPY